MTEVIYGHVQGWKHAGVGERLGLRLLSSANPPFSPAEKYHGLVAARLLALASGARILGAVISCDTYFEVTAPGPQDWAQSAALSRLPPSRPKKFAVFLSTGKKKRKSEKSNRGAESQAALSTSRIRGRIFTSPPSPGDTRSLGPRRCPPFPLGGRTSEGSPRRRRRRRRRKEGGVWWGGGGKVA